MQTEFFQHQPDQDCGWGPVTFSVTVMMTLTVLVIITFLDYNHNLVPGLGYNRSKILHEQNPFRKAAAG